MADFDLTALAAKIAMPSNDMIADDKGIPSFYVQRAPRLLSALVTGGDSSVHPAFRVNGDQVTRLLFGKFQGKNHGSRIYSLAGEDPTANITLDTFEQYCKNKGNGHHCITAAEWAFLALCAYKDGKMPKGNNNYGKDASETAYIAIPTTKSSGQTNRVATGTGPLTWSDTGDITGIFDLNGNVWEWCAGLRLVEGELQVIPDNDAADPECNTGATSTAWRAINAAATGWADLYVQPVKIVNANGEAVSNPNYASASTVKLDYVSSHWQWATSITSSSDSSRTATFGSTTASGLSDFAKMYLMAMALLPDGNADTYAGDKFYANNGAAERCAYRGGAWNDGAGGGVFALALDPPRSSSNTSFGGRPAFYE